MEISIYHIARTTFFAGREKYLTSMQWDVMQVLSIGPVSLEEIAIVLYGHRDSCCFKSLKNIIRGISQKYFIHSNDICKNEEGKYVFPKGVIVRNFKD